MSRPRDSQRSAVYAWERAVCRDFGEGLAAAGDGGVPRLDPREELSLPECQKLVDLVWREYRPLSVTRPPAVRDGRGRRRGWSGWGRIELPRFARRRYYVLHEVAHALGPVGAPHGPHFARLLLELLVRYAGVDRSRARRLGVHQKPRRVRFAPPGEVPQRQSRKVVRLADRVRALRRELRVAEAAYREEHKTVEKRT